MSGAVVPPASDDLPPRLLEPSPWRSALAIGLDWALIAACFAAAIRFPHPLVVVAAAVLVARTQLALAVLMHEAAHGSLARTRRCNDALGQLFAAGPLLLSLFAYRDGHLQHHRAPMADDDPVADVFGIADYPVSRGELAWRLIQDATGIGYVRTLLRIGRRHRTRAALDLRPSRPGRALFVVASIVGTNGLLLGGLVALGQPWLYVLLWTLPSLTVLQVFARIRAITEHAGFGACADQTRNARTIVRPSWQTFFCGPHGIHFHIEHHRHVRVPFHRLHEVHAVMRARGLLPADNLHRGYAQVLRDVTRRPGPRHLLPSASP